MTNLNSVLIEGNLVKDPTLSRGPENMAMTRFSVAVSRSTKDRDEKTVKRTIQIDILTLGKTAEMCAQCLKKGRRVRVVGRLDTEEDDVFIVGEHVEIKLQKGVERTDLPLDTDLII